MHIYVCREELR